MDILVLGANYGLLVAVRCAQAGHRVSVVCRPDEQDALILQGIDLDIRRRDGSPRRHVKVRAARGAGQSAGTVGLIGPSEVQPAAHDLCFLAMAEPQYAAPEVAQAMAQIAQADLPVLSMMNMVPTTYLRRLIGDEVEGILPAYGSALVWAGQDPGRFTAASPDAQAVRLDPSRPGQLTVTLASNFKVAPFARDRDQRRLEALCRDIGASGQDGIVPTMRLTAHQGAYVPLAKWPMLMSGNYRCRRPDGTTRSIAEAVHSDLAATQQIYDWVTGVLIRAGAPTTDLVPFAQYAMAARFLQMPSSVARGLSSGATKVERVDKLVSLFAAQRGPVLPALQEIVAVVDQALAANRNP